MGYNIGYAVHLYIKVTGIFGTSRHFFAPSGEIHVLISGLSTMRVVDIGCMQGLLRPCRCEEVVRNLGGQANENE